MIKGVAWVQGDLRKLGKVIVLNDGKRELLPTAAYITRNIQPPIYELPKQRVSAG